MNEGTAAPDIEEALRPVLRARKSVDPSTSVLTAISGIDGCGKGYVARHFSEALQSRGLRTAVINIDGWLNLPDKRFNAANPAEHFYSHAIRFEEMFEELIFPLRERRSVRLEADFAEETAKTYRKHVYEFQEIDIILLEGIFLLKRQFRTYYDHSLWVRCSFETALERAIARCQEGLGREETTSAYERIYFPAQKLHLERDDPISAATVILDNHPSLG